MPLARIETTASLTALIFLLLACFRVLQPFIFDLLWAGILCYVTWPLYEKLRDKNLHPNLAATIMVLPIGLILLTLFGIAGFNLTDDVRKIIIWFNQGSHQLPAPPAWLAKIPVVGASIQESWLQLGTDTGQLVAFAKEYVVGGGRWLLRQSIHFGAEVLHLSLSILILFFFYRDGEDVNRHLMIVIKKLAGEKTHRILDVVRSTLRAVVYGILGTAIVQAVASMIGLLIAEIPYAFALGIISFILAIIPMGLTLLWLPIAIWLLIKSQFGLAIFIALWYLLFVGTIDNWLRPLLISREIKLPLLLIIFGIFGGLLSFGFIGVFLGPTLLATGYALIMEWVLHKEQEASKETL